MSVTLKLAVVHSVQASAGHRGGVAVQSWRSSAGGLLVVVSRNDEDICCKKKSVEIVFGDGGIL